VVIHKGFLGGFFVIMWLVLISSFVRTGYLRNKVLKIPQHLRYAPVHTENGGYKIIFHLDMSLQQVGCSKFISREWNFRIFYCSSLFVILMRFILLASAETIVNFKSS
jgi:hypothetical protein